MGPTASSCPWVIAQLKEDFQHHDDPLSLFTYTSEDDAPTSVKDVSMVRWVQQTSDSPPLVTVKTTKCNRMPEHPKQVMEKVWKERKSTDAKVLCNGMQIQVHRCMLAAVSPVFEAALSSVMQEGASAMYEIKDSTPEAVEAMLCSVYTGELPPIELLPPVFELAMQYELAELAKATAARMVEDVSVSNVRETLAVLKLHRHTEAIARTAFEEVIRKLKEAKTTDLLIAAVG